MFLIKVLVIIGGIHFGTSSFSDFKLTKSSPTANELDKLHPKTKTISISNENTYFYRKIWIDDTKSIDGIKRKKSKVFNLFPVPTDGECVSNDGRRFGVCLNVYDCRHKGGSAKGDCAMGFGVCCIFEASCGGTITNNNTYLMSPNFPSTMLNNITFCKVKVKTMNPNISQLRINFNHFSIGQPNRKSGICDGDIFNVTGGPSGTFSLCGENSGQHIYYDINRNTANSTKLHHRGFKNINYGNQNDVEIILKFTKRFFLYRFWEIHILQIPFSQRAPNNCLQYFTGVQGVIQTFNFADNGRHLANQNYRSCIRQESNMCSIMYQPCDDQSFKIGPTKKIQSIGMTPNTITPENATEQIVTEPTANLPTIDNIEGSGEDNTQLPIITSRRPVRGGFDIFSLFWNTFNINRHKRFSKQLFTPCTDRITMPCIIEDFVGLGIGVFPVCEPVHCGSQFCSSGAKPCRIESTVKPFYLGVHFGDGIGKGSAEDNIGACIQYNQMQCM